MHPVPIGKRFKVVLEDHYLGTVTRKEFSLEDFEKLMNSRPGTTGRFTVEKDVILSEKFSPAITLPEGAKVISAAYHVHTAPSSGEQLQFGTEENPSMIGSKGFDEPFAERAPDSAELDKEQALGFTVSGLEEGQKVSGMVHVVIQYEKFNEWPDQPKTPDEANEMAGVARADQTESVQQQQQATDEAVKKGGEGARKSQTPGGSAAPKSPPAGAAQPGGQRQAAAPSAGAPHGQPGQGVTTAGS